MTRYYGRKWIAADLIDDNNYIETSVLRVFSTAEARDRWLDYGTQGRRTIRDRLRYEACEPPKGHITKHEDRNK